MGETRPPTVEPLGEGGDGDEGGAVGVGNGVRC